MESGRLTLYRGCTPVVDAQYGSGNGRSPTEAIIDALAEAADVDPIDLPPLYRYVDPDSLDNLFDRDGETEDRDTVLSFRVDSWNVFVRSDGKIRVCDGTERTEPAPIFERGVV